MRLKKQNGRYIPALKTTTEKNTPLAMALVDRSRPQATPLQAFKVARKWWMEKKHISIGELANELGVSRGTIYRWVGSKELLLDEIFWSLLRPAFEKAIHATPGQGIDHIVGVHRHFMTQILSSPPLEHFIKEDPNYSLRILTNLSSGVSKRIVKTAAAHLREQEALGHIRLLSPAEKLAEIFILANQAILYSDVISGRSPAIDKACSLIRMLLTSSESLGNQANPKNSPPSSSTPE